MTERPVIFVDFNMANADGRIRLSHPLTHKCLEQIGAKVGDSVLLTDSLDKSTCMTVNVPAVIEQNIEEDVVTWVARPCWEEGWFGPRISPNLERPVWHV